MSPSDDVAVFERYLAEVLVSVPEPGAPVKTPRHSLPTISPHDLERVLNDPRILFSSSDDGEPHKQLAVLYTFALWLRHSSPDHVPRYLASRAARLRFGIWSLAPRADWPMQWRSVRAPWSATGPPGAGGYAAFLRNIVLAEARDARDDWLVHLNTWEDDPWLAARDQRDPHGLGGFAAIMVKH